MAAARAAVAIDAIARPVRPLAQVKAVASTRAAAAMSASS